MAGKGEEVAVGVGAGAVGVGIGALLARRPALAAVADEKLDYAIELLEKQVQLLGQVIGLGPIEPGEEPLPDRLLALTRGQFLADPEGACSLINSHQPNLCRAAPIGIMTTLAPLATTTVISAIPKGFVCVMTRMESYTDIPFAVQAVMLRDGTPWYTDTGIVPASTNFRNWQAAATQWQTILINTSAILTVNIHLAVGGWQLEAKTYENVMAVLATLSYATSEHGTPEGAI